MLVLDSQVTGLHSRLYRSDSNTDEADYDCDNTYWLCSYTWTNQSRPHSTQYRTGQLTNQNCCFMLQQFILVVALHVVLNVVHEEMKSEGIL